MRPNRPQVKPARYEVRFTNGTWIIFDTWNYYACEAFRTRKAAFAALNAP